MECARSAPAAYDSVVGVRLAADDCIGDAGPSPAELEVRRALGALAALGASGGAGGSAADAAAAAREAVAAWVRRLRDHRGLPPERALVAVKRTARHALAPGLGARVGALTHEAAEARMADVVRWCIEAYYR